MGGVSSKKLFQQLVYHAAVLDLVIIGAGHAGLAASQRAVAAGLDHVVLERGEVGESWRSQRWDSFTLNTPNAMNGLPGSPYRGNKPDAFATRDAWVALLERYVAEHSLPVSTRTAVSAVEKDGERFVVTTARETIRTRNVIVASGTINAPKVPGIAAALDPKIARATTAGYRRAGDLPDGGVLVVGSAQSGVQIVEDLLDAGRAVHLSTGRVGRAPRRMRGRDTLVWLTETGWMDERPVDLPDPAMRFWAQPQISGVGPLGHTVSLQSLAARGVTLLGHLDAVDGTRMRFASDLPHHVGFGDETARRMRQDVDTHIARRGIDAPPSEPDPADEPVADPARFSGPPELDLAERGITSVVFSTGFTADFSWLRLPVTDDHGAPLHVEGRSPVPGVWFLGLPWMRTRKSGIIWGAVEDSRTIVDEVIGRIARVAM
jgi:putative flavoprotein involved in K+ transport